MLIKRTLHKTNKTLPLLLMFFFFSKCSSQIEEYPSLVNSGILALSTTNSSFGPNLFLASELEKSSFLFEHFKTKGAPTAIEILEEDLSSPRILLYYPAAREVYAADLQLNKERREWIVRGPYAIERRDFKSLMSMQTSMLGEPVFFLWEKPFRFRFHRHVSHDDTLRPEIPELPPPTPTHRPRPKKTTTALETPSSKTTSSPKVIISTSPSKPLSSDQQALLLTKGTIERSENGDLTYNVQVEGESFEAIVKWFTGSATEIDQVRTLSNIPPHEILKPGMKVKIPAGLVKAR